MPATKKRAARRSQVPAAPKKAAGYTISAPNPFYEGFFYDGKMRFIEGKARITDALARTATYRDATSRTGIPFEDAEQMARHFMDTVGNSLEDPDRQFKVTPALADLGDEARRVAPWYDRKVDGDYVIVSAKENAPEWAATSPAAPDEFNPNAGRSRRDRVTARTPVMQKPLLNDPNRTLEKEPAS